MVFWWNKLTVNFITIVEQDEVNETNHINNRKDGSEGEAHKHGLQNFSVRIINVKFISHVKGNIFRHGLLLGLGNVITAASVALSPAPRDEGSIKSPTNEGKELENVGENN